MVVVFLWVSTECISLSFSLSKVRMYLSLSHAMGILFARLAVFEDHERMNEGERSSPDRLFRLFLPMSFTLSHISDEPNNKEEDPLKLVKYFAYRFRIYACWFLYSVFTSDSCKTALKPNSSDKQPTNPPPQQSRLCRSSEKILTGLLRVQNRVQNILENKMCWRVRLAQAYLLLKGVCICDKRQPVYHDSICRVSLICRCHMSSSGTVVKALTWYELKIELDIDFWMGIVLAVLYTSPGAMYSVTLLNLKGIGGIEIAVRRGVAVMYGIVDGREGSCDWAVAVILSFSDEVRNLASGSHFRPLALVATG
ncbi:hypothetical protein RHSIM_Rhsim01G0147100 [Rhododendron simsii]|uniref:Uncharacterized protein n=1 Tax=Rhododendron simsii TaxID=118357 RepID=A0A834LWY4_RHOSS|nr:hypothetical protein RHSIM_Rhsim01G0147100 [Rhododendron simsii]